MKNEAEEPGVDKIFALENLDGFLKYISQKVGDNVSVRWLNSSPTKVHNSVAIEFVDNVRRKLFSKLTIDPAPVMLEADHGLSPRQIRSMRDYLAHDFKLYERVKALGTK